MKLYVKVYGRNNPLERGEKEKEEDGVKYTQPESMLGVLKELDGKCLGDLIAQIDTEAFKASALNLAESEEEEDTIKAFFEEVKETIQCYFNPQRKGQAILFGHVACRTAGNKLVKGDHTKTKDISISDLIQKMSMPNLATPADIITLAVYKRRIIQSTDNYR